MLHQPPLSSAVSNLQIRASSKFSETCYRKSQSVPAPFLVGIELNPGPTPLTEKQRWWIVFLSQEEGRTPTEIARKVGCSRPTVYSVLNKESETGTVHNRPKSGRKRKLTKEEEKKVVKKHRKSARIKLRVNLHQKDPNKLVRGLFAEQ